MLMGLVEYAADFHVPDNLQSVRIYRLYVHVFNIEYL